MRQLEKDFIFGNRLSSNFFFPSLHLQFICVVSVNCFFCSSRIRVRAPEKKKKLLTWIVHHALWFYHRCIFFRFELIVWLPERDISAVNVPKCANCWIFSKLIRDLLRWHNYDKVKIHVITDCTNCTDCIIQQLLPPLTCFATSSHFKDLERRKKMLNIESVKTFFESFVKVVRL